MSDGRKPGPTRTATGPQPRHVPEKRPGQKGGKRDENRKKRVRGLCQASLTLMLSKGIESVTVDEIVTAAGVAKGSFYRYFKDKGELVDTLFQPLGEQMRAAFAQADAGIAAADSDAALLMAYAGIGQSMQAVLTTYPREILLYLQECRAPRTPDRAAVRGLADEIADAAVTLTGTARERGLLKKVASRVSALTVVGAVERMLFEVLSGGDLGAPPAQVTITLITLIMNGLAAHE